MPALLYLAFTKKMYNTLNDNHLQKRENFFMIFYCHQRNFCDKYQQLCIVFTFMFPVHVEF